MSVNYGYNKNSYQNSGDISEDLQNPNDINSLNENKDNSEINENKNNKNENNSTSNKDNKENDSTTARQINIKITKAEPIQNNNDNNPSEENQNNNNQEESPKEIVTEFSKKIKNKNEDLSNREDLYKNQISLLEQKIKEIQENHKINMLQLANEGKGKDTDLKSLSKENNTLKNNLESISLKLDELIYKSTSNPRKMIQKAKLDENKKKESNYEFQILIRDKEIKNKQHLIEILQKDNKKLKNSLNTINNNSDVGGNQIKKQLNEKNMEIFEIQNKLKDYKLKVSEHYQCGKKIEYLNKMIESKTNEIREKKKEVIKKENQTNRLNTKINMVDKALEVLEENKSKNKNKLKAKQKKYLLNHLKEIDELNQMNKNNDLSQKYVNTSAINQNNVKNKILKKILIIVILMKKTAII